MNHLSTRENTSMRNICKTKKLLIICKERFETFVGSNQNEAQEGNIIACFYLFENSRNVTLKSISMGENKK